MHAWKQPPLAAVPKLTKNSTPKAEEGQETELTGRLIPFTAYDMEHHCYN